MLILQITASVLISLLICVPTVFLIARWMYRKEAQDAQDADQRAEKPVVNPEPEFPENWC